MGLQIEDGKGKGYSAQVDAQNGLRTTAITNCDCKDNSLLHAQSYEFATGAFIAVTTTAEHAILYLKNTSGTRRLHIHTIRTCGTALQKWFLYKNDTGGTIISDANAGVEVNHNFSSSNTAEADVWAASGAGKSRSGGTILSQHINEEGHSEIEFSGALILGQNDSLTLTVQNADTASKEACARIHAYYETIVT